ncbi:hypothetical protein J2S43_006100 [Catenuloplanes nepalensis]|uniref:Uncharacterized protein n=1 Tax=Catenuloplanes nepalensis TaxID=587533 RepID=A0ABT9N1L3_9ACTN|nr:hypothetical protein [Catenuloplanes nepalensis]MDP9797588.1 hypothetical protein [Catenuloplanes nepalensis]
MTQLHAVSGRFTTEPDGLAALTTPVPRGGLLLGRDRNGKPVPLEVFGPSGADIALIGNWWAARLIVFRALALGARVVVSSHAPDQWQNLGQWATGRPDRLMLVHGLANPGSIPSGTAIQPVLHVVDVHPEAAEAALTQPLQPWQARLTVVQQLIPAAGTILRAATFAVVQRLNATEATVGAAPLRLSGRDVKLFQRLNVDMAVLLGNGPEAQYLWFTPTSIEQQALGNAPRRS